MTLSNIVELSINLHEETESILKKLNERFCDTHRKFSSRFVASNEFNSCDLKSEVERRFLTSKRSNGKIEFVKYPHKKEAESTTTAEEKLKNNLTNGLAQLLSEVVGPVVKSILPRSDLTCC